MKEHIIDVVSNHKMGVFTLAMVSTTEAVSRWLPSEATLNLLLKIGTLLTIFLAIIKYYYDIRIARDKAETARLRKENELLDFNDRRAQLRKLIRKPPTDESDC